MKFRLSKDTEILDQTVDNMDTYWTQSFAFDRRPFDTHSIMSSSLNQVDSQRAFSELLAQLSEKR